MQIVSVRYRLLAAFAVATAIIVVLFGGALFWGMNVSFNERMHRALQSVVLDIENDILENEPHPIGPQKRYTVSPLFMEIYEDRGGKLKRLVATPNMKGHHLPVLPDTKNQFKLISIPFVSRADESAYLTERFHANDKSYIIAAATPIDHADDMLEIFLSLFAAIGVIFYLLSLWFASRLIDSILEPMKRMTEAAGNIAEHDLSRRIPLPSRHDEFYRLAATFNAMLERIESAFSRMKRFNVNVSHELKTPLTIIRGEAEVALMKPRDTATYEATLRSIMQESETMQRIIESMLMLSHQNQDALKTRMQPIRLDTLLTNVCRKMNPLAASKKTAIYCVHPEPVTITAEPQLLEEAFVNLLDNAVKYSPEGSSVHVSMEMSNNEVSVTISDEGVGIDSKNIPRLFEPFWREEKAHSKRVPGQVLGLALVEWIMQVHDASIEIVSEKGRGTTCRLQFQVLRRGEDEHARADRLV